MEIINRYKVIRLLTLAGMIAAALMSGAAQGPDKPAGPALPPICSAIEVPAGNKIASRTYAVGVQIYRWNGGSWEFIAPNASLFADEDHRALIGSHFGGPTWMSSGGSNVVAARVDGCTPEATAIPWLLLKSTKSEGGGAFGKTTFIHRVNTAGGLEPATPGPSVGFQVKVPYTAEYYFYEMDK